jgi:hypothetical protein
MWIKRFYYIWRFLDVILQNWLFLRKVRAADPQMVRHRSDMILMFIQK